MATAPLHTADDFSPHDLAAIERGTQEIGRYLFEHLNTSGPSPWERRWWDDRIMAWAMHDEAIKVQLFRFIDVLPMLHDCRCRGAAFGRISVRRGGSVAVGRAVWIGGGESDFAGPARVGGHCAAECDDACPAVHCRDRCQGSAGGGAAPAAAAAGVYARRAGGSGDQRCGGRSVAAAIHRFD